MATSTAGQTAGQTVGQGEEAGHLAAGVDYLDAIQVDGDYAYLAAETRRWWVCTAEEVVDLGERLAADPDRGYSEWCSGWSGEEVDGLAHDILDAICAAGGAAERDYTCQCGQALGERCAWSGHREELVLVRWVPDSDVGSAQASGTGTYGAYARRLYVAPECAEVLRYVYVDGERTEVEDPYVRVVGPAYD